MKLVQQTIQEVKLLSSSDLSLVYNLILSLNEKKVKSTPSIDKSVPPYMKVREALKGCQGSLSQDIINAREDRI